MTFRPLLSAISAMALIATLTVADPARAQTSVAQPVVEALLEEGFKVTEIRRTLLGRILVVSQSDQHLREVVLNRRDGRVLDDRLFPLPDEADAPIATLPGVAGGQPSGTIGSGVGSVVDNIGGSVGGIGGGGGGGVDVGIGN